MAKYITLNGSDGSGGLKRFLTDLRSTKFKAASDKYGAIKLGYTQNDKNYPVQLDGNGKAYVYVPWTNNTYTFGTGFSNTANGVELKLKDFNKSTLAGSYTNATNSNRFYSVCLGSSLYLSVPVPWVNDSVTSEAKHYRPSGQDQKNETSKFYKFSIDAAGHISSYSSVTKQDILNLGIVDSGDQIKIEDITYSKLYNLVTNSNLIPGKKYRITDYVTVLDDNSYMIGGEGGINVKVTSKNNTFKILVKAISSNKLSEDAKLENVDDVYDIKYCISNDTNKFKWASSQGKGVIYYMKDKWNNEAPYDFKSILFNGKFTFTGETAGTDTSLGSDVNNNFIGDLIIGSEANIYVRELPYNLFVGTPCVFNKIGTNSINNIIKGNRNEIGYNNTNTNISGDNNTIGNSCANITLEQGNKNNIGDCCTNVTFGDSCNNNNVGDSCNDVTFGDSCNNNKVGNNCKKSLFGKYCNYNTVVDNNTSSGVLFKFRSTADDSARKALDRVENCIFNKNSAKIYLDKFHGSDSSGQSNFSKYFDINNENLLSSYKFNNMEFLSIGSSDAPGEIISINIDPTADQIQDTKISNLLNRTTPVLFATSSCVIKNYYEINF